jgi:outer membrane protein OmpA-like peptidoglycan-associated protein
MKKICALLLSASVIHSPLAHAENETPATVKNKTTGFGIGALLGGLIGGPPGAVIGASGGKVYGNYTAGKTDTIANLEQKLQNKDIDLAALQDEITRVQINHAGNLQAVALEGKQASLQKLGNGISFSIYFRTNDTGIDPVLNTHIHDLVNLIRDLPEIRVQLEAHADERGLPSYNMQLSHNRARAVQAELINAGLPADRIQKYTYGESRARTKIIDQENYIFDRRVDIKLTLDTSLPDQQI